MERRTASLVVGLCLAAAACGGPIAPPPALAGCTDGGAHKVSISGRDSWGITYNTTAELDDDGTSMCWHVATDDSGGMIAGAHATGSSLGGASGSTSRPLNVSTTVSRGGTSYTVTFVGSFDTTTCTGSGSFTVTAAGAAAPSMSGRWTY